MESALARFDRCGLPLSPSPSAGDSVPRRFLPQPTRQFPSWPTSVSARRALFTGGLSRYNPVAHPTPSRPPAHTPLVFHGNVPVIWGFRLMRLFFAFIRPALFLFLCVGCIHEKSINKPLNNNL